MERSTFHDAGFKGTRYIVMLKKLIGITGLSKCVEKGCHQQTNLATGVALVFTQKMGTGYTPAALLNNELKVQDKNQSLFNI